MFETLAQSSPEHSAKRDEYLEKVQENSLLVEQLKSSLLYRFVNVCYMIKDNRFGIISSFDEKGIFFGDEHKQYFEIMLLTKENFELLDKFHKIHGQYCWMNPNQEMIEQIFGKHNYELIKLRTKMLKNINRKKDKFGLILCDTIPTYDNMYPNIIYVSKMYGCASHICPCGCGKEIPIPLKPKWEDGWNYIILGENTSEPTISFTPSLLNVCCPNNSHYFIQANEIKWCDK